MSLGATGRTRHRVEQRWFAKPLVVLQIEETVRHYDSGTPSADRYFDQVVWRDALPEDLLPISEKPA